MEHSERKKLAAHVATLLRSPNVDTQKVGNDIVREFPQLNLELDREFAKLAQREVALELRTFLSERTNHPISREDEHGRALETSILDFFEKELGYFSQNAGAISDWHLKQSDDNWQSMLKSESWRTSVIETLPDDRLLRDFYLGNIKGFTGDTLYVVGSFNKIGQIPRPERVVEKGGVRQSQPRHHQSKDKFVMLLDSLPQSNIPTEHRTLIQMLSKVFKEPARLLKIDAVHDNEADLLVTVTLSAEQLNALQTEQFLHVPNPIAMGQKRERPCIPKWRAIAQKLSNSEKAQTTQISTPSMK